MKQINEITQEHIDTVKAIKDDCNKTHVLCPPFAYFKMEIKNANGEKELDYKFPSKSWVRNAYNAMITGLTGIPTNKLGSAYAEGMLAIGERYGAIVANATQTNVSINGLAGATGATTMGILAGTGAYSESFKTRSLGIAIPEGNTKKVMRGANPLPVSNINSKCSVYSPDNAHLVVGHDAAPYIEIFNNQGDVITKIADPDVMPTGAVYSLRYSADGVYLIATHETTPFVTIYQRNGNVYTKLANPDVLPAGAGLGCCISGDGVYLIVVNKTASPYAIFYKRTDNVFAKLADPSTMPGWGSSACAMSTDGVYCIIPTDNVYITELFLYKRTGDTFNLIDHPAHSPAADYYPSVALSNDGTYLALACSFAYTWVYKRTGDTYNRISSGATIGPGYPVKVDLNSDGSFLTIATNNAVYMFKRDETDVYNETTPDNATNLGANVKSVKFSDDGKQIVVSTNTDGPVLARFTLEQGLSYSSTSVSSTYDAGTKKMTIAIARSLSNNSTTETVTINEIGVYAQLTTGNYSMLNREKLSSPVALAPSAVATVTFNIEIVYPG